MKLTEMKKKILALIEELNPDSPYLTDDMDIRAKINEVINQVMFELARWKKIPKLVTLEVTQGQLVHFSDLESACGSDIYQIAMVTGAACIPRAGGTLLQFTENGTAQVDVFVYPERISAATSDRAYELELTPDALEVMPYGVAADLLKTDVSANYGAVYAARYESMLQRMDPRYQTGYITAQGGVHL